MSPFPFGAYETLHMSGSRSVPPAGLLRVEKPRSRLNWGEKKAWVVRGGSAGEVRTPPLSGRQDAASLRPLDSSPSQSPTTNANVDNMHFPDAGLQNCITEKEKLSEKSQRAGSLHRAFSLSADMMIATKEVLHVCSNESSPCTVF